MFTNRSSLKSVVAASSACLTALCALTSHAAAQCGPDVPPIINGTANASDCGYITLTTQTLNTTFADATLGQTGFCNGSELDSLSYRVVGNTLYLFIAGNLQSNFVKLELFFDSIPGQGQNRLRGDNPNVDGNGLNRMGFFSSTQQGLKFDTGFAADRWISLTGGNPGNGLYTLFANYAEILTNGGGTGAFLGNTPQTSTGDLLNGTNPFGIKATINNSNTAGVGSGTGVGSGAGVTTGVEMAIPLAALGITQPCGEIKLCAFINDPSHAFISNQVLPPLPAGFSNLAEPRTADFSAYAGDQFVTIPLGSAPTINTAGQPAPQTVCASSSASLSVSATASGSPTFQWQFADPSATPQVWTNLSNGDWLSAGQRRAVVAGATTASLALASFYSGPDFPSVHVPVLLRCVVTNSCGSVSSDGALLTVNSAPSITGQPTNATACAGGSATLSVAATASTPLAYVWQIQDAAAPGGWVDLNDGPISVNGNPWGSVSGSRTPNCLFLHGLGTAGPTITARCVITNTCGSATSNPANISVCRADFNCQNGVGVQDIFDFLAAWFAGDPRADFNGANGVGVQDIFDFLAIWFQGC